MEQICYHELPTRSSVKGEGFRMKKVMYVGHSEKILSRLKPDWELATRLDSAEVGLHALIQDAVLADCDIVVFESPRLLKECHVSPEVPWSRIKQYASRYMEATGWFVELFLEEELMLNNP